MGENDGRREGEGAERGEIGQGEKSGKKKKKNRLVVEGKRYCGPQ